MNAAFLFAFATQLRFGHHSNLVGGARSACSELIPGTVVRVVVQSLEVGGLCPSSVAGTAVSRIESEALRHMLPCQSYHLQDDALLGGQARQSSSPLDELVREQFNMALAPEAASLHQQRASKETGLLLLAAAGASNALNFPAAPSRGVKPGCDDAPLQLARLAIMSRIRTLLDWSELDRGRILGAVGVWRLYEKQFGADCTCGLLEMATELVQTGMLTGLPDNSLQQLPWPEWLQKRLADETSCYMWVAAVGLELLLYASEHFEEQFMSSDELNARVKQNKLSSLYVWSSIIAEQDIRKFYTALTDTFFKTNARSTYVPVKCRTRSGKMLSCVACVSAHVGAASDGSPTRAYCVRFWPLVARPLVIRSAAAGTSDPLRPPSNIVVMR